MGEGASTVKCDTEGTCPWSYPMSATVGKDHHVNGTGAQCHCSTQSYFTQGAGCYLAFATLAQYAGMFPAVFVKIGGTCDKPNSEEDQACFARAVRTHLLTALAPALRVDPEPCITS